MARNKEYWIARALQRENEAYLRGVELTAKMFQEYDRAAKAIRREIGDFYSKYAGKYGLTYDQAVRLLTRKEFQEWKATLAEYVARIAQEPDPRVKAVLTAQLDALSTNSRISRLEALLGQIDLKLNDLWETGVAQMKAEFGDAFQEGYYKKLYDIQSRVGFFHEIAKLDESVVEDVLSLVRRYVFGSPVAEQTGPSVPRPGNHHPGSHARKEYSDHVEGTVGQNGAVLQGRRTPDPNRNNLLPRGVGQGRL